VGADLSGSLASRNERLALEWPALQTLFEGKAMNLQNITNFLEIFLRSPQDRAALKIVTDFGAIAQDWLKDPRLPGVEADIQAYLALLPPSSATPAAQPETPPASSGGHPSGTNRGGLMPAGD
jgi:hypothetical protein